MAQDERYDAPMANAVDASGYRATDREYVGAVFELEEEGIPAIQARIADWLGVSRPAVSEMVHRLERDGLVDVGDVISLTEEGRHLAQVVVRRHRLAERFLTEVLGLPWVKVHEEAEVWEHAISDEVESAIWNKLSDAKTCPHGNPIPGAGYRPPPIKALGDLEVGERWPLERISEELELDMEVMDFLDVNGLHPGALIDLRSRSPHGVLTVAVNDGAAVGVSTFVAERLFVGVSDERGQ